MPTQGDDRNDLIAMLTWQFEMGVDEALLDYPDPGLHWTKLESLPAPEIMSTTQAMGGFLSEKSKPAISAHLQTITERDMVVSTQPDSINDLSDLQAGLAMLDECPLKHTASNICFADGNPGARLMIIGEVPGRDEDRMGIPFVGLMGQLLDKMLASVGLDRTSTYIINLLPWRPPGNRSPTSEEITMLTPWIFRHVQLAKPDIVLLLGGAPAKFFFSSQDGIMKSRGTWRDLDFGDGILRPTLASLHPAYLLRSPAQKRFAFEDLLLLATRLNIVTSNDKSG